MACTVFTEEEQAGQQVVTAQSPTRIIKGALARRRVLTLYRRILRTHRTMLPGPLRAMGDAYARDEFRRHRDAKTTPAQWRAFVQEWQRYLGMLQGTADLPGASGDIPEHVLAGLSAQQQQQLARLREEAARAREEILSGGTGGGKE